MARALLGDITLLGEHDTVRRVRTPRELSFPACRQLFQRVLATREKTFGSDNLAVAPILNNLASAYVQTGAYDRALPSPES